ncbi:hypothetical protein HGI47_16910 [Novosphingobium sp. ERN07]|uniref:hypothetical protein n=1 Tax=Novosphingobium sp. ERN07 TaxID=2726187 RepID=UPI0014567010|nr:hypothetical protein [Novosphingobium sp. ERN07]NLR72559.1 hypothetical protein [Novosphingobium sp. ERN07]
MQNPIIIIDEKSWLRSFPICIEPEFKLIVDYIIYSSDAICYCINSIVNNLKYISIENNKNNYITPTFLYCWSLIDEIYSFYKILKFYEKKMGGCGPIAKSLIDDMNDFIFLRNRFRHFNDQIRNIANSKSKDALIGSVSWIAWPNPEEPKFRSYALRLGLLHGGEKIPIVNPSGLKIIGPISHISFSAYGRTVAFLDIIEKISEWIQKNFDKVKEDISKKIIDLSNINGINEGEFWKSSGSAHLMCLEFSS